MMAKGITRLSCGIFIQIDFRVYYYSGDIYSQRRSQFYFQVTLISITNNMMAP